MHTIDLPLQQHAGDMQGVQTMQIPAGAFNQRFRQ